MQMITVRFCGERAHLHKTRTVGSVERGRIYTKLGLYVQWREGAFTQNCRFSGERAHLHKTRTVDSVERECIYTKL